MKNKKLVFEASMYRDWSVMYCQIAYYDWVVEMRKKFDWGLSDLCFVWDGHVTTLYRAPEEHLAALLKLAMDRTRQNPNFLKEAAHNAYVEAKEYETYLNNLEKIDFQTLSYREFSSIFKEFLEKTMAVVPNVFISVYIPQAFEFLESPENRKKFESDIEALIQTRNKIDYIVGPMGNKMSEVMCHAVLSRIGVDTKLSRFITIEEFEEVLKKEDSFSKEDIANLVRNLTSRMPYFLEGGGKIWDISLKQYLAERGWELKEYDTQESVIRGVSAYKVPQKLTGKVKVIMNKRELHKMNQGDILVAPMTTPEYMPIIKKASAIITDEGGVTCHAAINARELKIPTIIGTKIASKVLKDGDMVEMDTERGMVTVIK